MDTAQQLALVRWSRGTVLKTAGGAAAGFTLAQARFVRSMAQESDEIQDILDITATTERFGVTFLGEGIRAAEENEFDIQFLQPVIAILKAARAQEAFHLEEFESLGGKARVETFTVPPDALTSFKVFFQAIVDQETRETAAQIAAMRVFSELGRPTTSPSPTTATRRSTTSTRSSKRSASSAAAGPRSPTPARARSTIPA